FDFHQIVDSFKEVGLVGASIGTTKKDKGPAYSSKASRNFRQLVTDRIKRYGNFEYDVERYK
ncbi:1552_t:CDS:2, partial [Diversispora eburnea]